VPLIRTNQTKKFTNVCCRLFHPNEGVARPLDAIVGINPNAKCPTTEGPIVRVVVQQNPADDEQCVMVIIIENFVSDDFLRQVECGVDLSKFRPLSNGTYLRQATHVTPEYRKKEATCAIRMRPVQVFGGWNSLRFYQCTFEVNEHEVHSLAMAKKVESVIDEVNGEILDCMAHALGNRKPPPNPQLTSPNPQEAPFHSYSESSFFMPIAPKGRPPHDAPDTIVVQVSSHHSYHAHSDADDKYDNANNDNCVTHSKMLRIVTGCYVFCKKGVKLQYPVVTIQHGLPPGKSGGKFGAFKRICDFFYDSKNGCHTCKRRPKGKIPMGYSSHMHIQNMGSQPGIYHSIEPSTKKQAGVVRVVKSHRCLLDTILTDDRINECYPGKKIPLHPWQGHEATLILTKMLDETNSRFRVATGGNREACTVEDHSHESDADDDDGGNADGNIEVVDGSNGEVLGEDSPQIDEGVSVEEGPQKYICGLKSSRSGVQPSKEFPAPIHMNCELLPCEITSREYTKGPQPRVTLDMIPQIAHTARGCYDLQKTVILNREGKDAVIIGPLTHVEGDRLVLTKPGTELKEEVIRSKLGMHPGQYKKVHNPKRSDVVCASIPTKNHSSLLEYMIQMKNNPFRPGRVLIGGVGGAPTKVDQNDRTLTDPNATKGGITHYFACHQDPDNPFNRKMMRKSNMGHVFILLYRNIYLGSFELVGYTQVAMDEVEYERELRRFDELMPHVHRLYPNQFSKPHLTREERKYATQMCTKRIFFIFKPLTTQPLDPWDGTNGQSPVPWDEVILEQKDFCIPVERGPKKVTYDSVDDCLDEEIVRKLDDLVRLSKDKLPHLNNSGRQKLGLPDVNQKRSEEWARQISFDQWINGLIYLSVATAAKTCGDCVSNDKETMIPPRFLAVPSHSIEKHRSRRRKGQLDLKQPELKTEKEKNEYASNLRAAGILSLLLNPTHPGHVMQDLVTAIACYSTNSLDEAAGEHRLGPGFFTSDETKELAFDIFYQCFLSCLFMPSATLKLFYGTSEKERSPWTTVVPRPREKEMVAFENALRQHKWEPTKILHPTFARIFPTVSSVVDFLGALRRSGLVKVVKAVADGRGCRDRTKTELLRNINRLHDKGDFDSFHIQSTMRTVERCCHEPFGPVNEVEGGPGGNAAAKLLEEAYKRDVDEPPATKDAVYKAITGWLLKKLNDRAQTRLEDPLTKREMELELSVIGWEWCEKRKCLVHNWGIKPKVDACDTEHCDCGVYGLRKNVLPEHQLRKNPMMDKNKFAPVRVPTTGLGKYKYARNLPVFEGLVKILTCSLHSFFELKAIENYEHRKLCEIFQVEMRDEKEMEEEGDEEKMDEEGGEEETEE